MSDLGDAQSGTDVGGPGNGGGSAGARPVAPADGLVADGLVAVYGELVEVLRGASITLAPSTVVALLGPNGAGKTTMLRGLTGLMSFHGGRIVAGTVSMDGETLPIGDPAAVVRRGVAQVMEGRRIIGTLTAEENLRLGAYTRPRRLAANLERVYGLFGRLADRRGQVAGTLSGGEQQMLAIGRALMSEPAYLLLDEPSLGLAPQLVAEVRDLIVEIHQSGVAILLVEQNATMALSIADHAYVLEGGRVVLDGGGKDLLARSDVAGLYLGDAPELVGSSQRRRWPW